MQSLELKYNLHKELNDVEQKKIPSPVSTFIY